MSELFTVSKAANYANRQASSIRRAIDHGHLKAEKVGEVWIIRKHDLDSYLDNPPKRGPKPKKP